MSQAKQYRISILVAMATSLGVGEKDGLINVFGGRHLEIQ